MNVTLWGTRGSLASPGPETARYGGNTACVQVQGADGTLIALDAGTGIRRMGAALPSRPKRVDILLSHLHLDHIQGLGFFAPLFDEQCGVHIWAPAGGMVSLEERLMRYMSPPLFPVYLRELPSQLTLHEIGTRRNAQGAEQFEIGEFRVTAAPVCHPGATLGYRITAQGTTHGATYGVTVTYLSDHEPALGVPNFPSTPDWTSGHILAAGADLLIHDAQYTQREYANHVGWGHSSFLHALQFAQQACVKQLVLFHHDPSHSDSDLDQLGAQAAAWAGGAMRITVAAEGMSFDLG
jgi:phosphoribosyl 1,2-cyclic phosphodiesterase